MAAPSLRGWGAGGAALEEAPASAQAEALRLGALLRALAEAEAAVPGRAGSRLGEWRMDSVKRKRKKKMNKHLHRKRRRLNRGKK